MHDKLWLFTVVGKAVLIVTIGCFVLVLGVKFAVTSGEQQVLGAIMAFLPAGFAAWWMFRKLQEHYTRREARAMAIAFGVFTPVSLLMGVLLAQIPGSYAVLPLGSPSGHVGELVGFSAGFVSIVMITALVSFVPSVLALWITRRIRRVDAAEPPAEC